MKNLRWYHILLLIIGILGILLGPWIFTHPHLPGCESLDFSRTGNIGDTIGGITAPIVGLVSVFLLWWTLKAQLEFNARQDEINREQKEYNDTMRILTLEAQLSQLAEGISFGYSTRDGIGSGRGLNDLTLIDASLFPGTSIVDSEFADLYGKVVMFDNALDSLYQLVANDRARGGDRANVGIYLMKIAAFYQMVAEERVNILSLNKDIKPKYAVKAGGTMAQVNAKLDVLKDERVS